MAAVGTDNTGINSYLATVATLALSNVQTAFGACWFGNEHVDLMPTTQTVWDILWNKIQPQQRFMDESSDVAKIGFQALRYNGASLVVDQYAPTGYLWFLNTKYIQFWISTLPKYQSTRLPRTVTCDGKPALIDSDAAMQTRRNANSDRDRLSERASQEDDAIVGSHGNWNHESATEMIAPVQYSTSNNSLVLRGGKRLNIRSGSLSSSLSELEGSLPLAA